MSMLDNRNCGVSKMRDEGRCQLRMTGMVESAKGVVMAVSVLDDRNGGVSIMCGNGGVSAR